MGKQVSTSRAIVVRDETASFEPVRPTQAQVIDAIMETLADGNGLRQFLKGQRDEWRKVVPHRGPSKWHDDNPWPSVGRFLTWIDRDAPAGIADRYVRARLLGLDAMAEDIIAIADDPAPLEHVNANAAVNQAKLRADTRKWILAKLHPNRYGDHVNLQVTDATERKTEGEIQTDLLRAFGLPKGADGLAKLGAMLKQLGLADPSMPGGTGAASPEPDSDA